MTLRIEKLSYSVGSNTIVDGVTATAKVGNLIGLVGPNGAGKSTFANLVTGFVPASTGAVYFKGNSLLGLAPKRIARLGVGRTFQNQHLPWNLTTLDCIRAVLSTNPTNGMQTAQSTRRSKWSADRHIVSTDILSQIGLSASSLVPVRDLSFGQQRLLGLAMALARPSQLLILDEPFTGLKSGAVKTVIALLRREAKTRLVIVIDHMLSAVRELGSCFWFMNRGRMTAYTTFDAMAASDDFRRSYLGTASDRIRPKADADIRPSTPDRISGPMNVGHGPVLALKNLGAGYGNTVVIQDANLEVYPGDLLCIIGLNGAGKSTLLRAVVGLARRFHGELLLHGTRPSPITPAAMARKGVRLFVQDKRLFSSLTLRDNLLVSAAGLVAGRGSNSLIRLTTAGAVNKCVDDTIHALQLGGHELQDRSAGTFSGGEQARIALAQIQFGRPTLLLLDEPTSGMDGIAIESLRAVLAKWRAQRIPVIMVEHALDFVASVASRIVVVANGRTHELEAMPHPDAETLGTELLKHLASTDLGAAR